MTLLRSLVMAFSCFSQVPMPHVEWKPESMRYMMCFFPAVGALIGLLLCAWCWFCGALGFGAAFRAGGLVLVPVVVTGGIHLDGLADTADALASNAPPDRRREILKDSHAGAFAVIGIVAYFIAYFACATEFDPARAMVQLALAPVLSRSLSGIATVAFPLSAGRGMLADEQESSSKRGVLVALAVIAACCAVALVWLDVAIGLSMVVVALACLAALYGIALSAFGGMSGDLAGFFLQMCELALLACIVIACKVVGA